MPVIKWAAYAREVAGHERQARATRRQEGLKSFRRREDYEFMPEQLAANKPGRQRMLYYEECRTKMLDRISDERGLRLSYDQHRLLDELRNTMILKFYGGIENALADKTWLRDNYGVETIYDCTAVIYPRRHGKTLTQTINGGITMLSQPRGNVLDYNMKNDQARVWMTQCEAWLELMRRDNVFGWAFVAKNEGKFITIRTNLHKSLSQLNVYGNATNKRDAQALRGTGNDAMCVNLDEGFFFVDEAYVVILPVVANGAALIITSSKPTTATHAYQMVHAKSKTGAPLFRVLDWRRACAECQAREDRTGRETHCPHIVHKPMHFRSRADMEKLAALMRPFGEDTYEREMMNVMGGGAAQKAFEADVVDAAIGMDTKLVEELGSIPYFFVGVDPGGLRGRSETTITSACFVRTLRHLPDTGYELLVNNHCVILGTEELVKDLSGITTAIDAHIRAVRQLPGLAEARAVLCVENNMELIVDEVYRQLTNRLHTPKLTLLNLDVVFSKKRGADGELVDRDGFTYPGIRTTDRSKNAMMETVREMFETRRVHWHRDFVAYAYPDADHEADLLAGAGDNLAKLAKEVGITAPMPPPSAGREHARFRADVFAQEAHKRVRANVLTQWKNLELVTTETVSKDGTKRKKFKYSGKNRAGGKDDHTMSFVIMLQGAIAFLQQPEYAVLRANDAKTL